MVKRAATSFVLILYYPYLYQKSLLFYKPFISFSLYILNSQSRVGLNPSISLFPLCFIYLISQRIPQSTYKRLISRDIVKCVNRNPFQQYFSIQINLGIKSSISYLRNLSPLHSDPHLIEFSHSFTFDIFSFFFFSYNSKTNPT